MTRVERRRLIRRRRIFVASVCAGLIAAIVLVTVLVGAIKKIGDKGEVSSSPQTVQSETDTSVDTSSEVDSSSEASSVITPSQSTTSSTPVKPNKKRPGKPDKSVTVLNTGDILIHDNLLWGAKQADGSYDFSKFFMHSRKYINAANFAIANLEVTLGGEAAGNYRGYPGFNSPDSLIDYLKADGFDLLLTSNNHSLDTGAAGLKRTVQQLKARNMGFLGTKETANDPTYIVKDVGGIKIGMVCYTYGTNNSTAGAESLINRFSSSNLAAFYTAAQGVIDSMKRDGAEAIVFYMHWGQEYKTSPNTYQKSIAQQLCNMGVDVIVGAHPHVIQPIDLLYSEDSQNTTVCLYSMGNAISNQRIEEMTGLCTSGHTEDGLFFNYTFSKDSDGVYLSGVDIIPTWVNRYGNAGDYDYTVYPMESADMSNSYGLDAATAAKARASYERTMAIVGEGLKRCKDTIG